MMKHFKNNHMYIKNKKQRRGNTRKIQARKGKWTKERKEANVQKYP